MHQHHDHDHDHRELDLREEPMDAAHQSLADALRSSFSILKGIMLVLVVLYLFSNVRTIDASEQAVVLRFGRLLEKVYDPGLVWAFPFPIDEIVPLPTRQSSEVIIDSHSFHRTADEKDKPLSFIARGHLSGLNPSLDGALLTSEAGLVHVRWKVTYKISQVRDYLSNIIGDRTESADDLIRLLVENIGIDVASRLTAEEVTRTRVDFVQQEMRRQLNERLTELGSGIEVTLVEMFEPTPPIPVRDAFELTQQAENRKTTRINEAVQQRTRLLNGVAGAAHKRIVDALDAIDAAESESRRAELQRELDRLLADEAEGRAGQIIKEAESLMSVVVDRMRSDIELYRTLVPEYERSPELLIERLWEETRLAIFKEPGVVKFYRPANAQFRLHVPLDPDQVKIDEELRLQEQQFDPSQLRERHMVPMGPEGG